VILAAAFLLLVALGLLAGGLAQGSAALQWGSFAASALAALVLAVGELRRRRAGQQDETPERTPAAAARSDLGALVATPAEARGSVTPSAEPATVAPAPPAPAAEPATAAVPPPVQGPATGRPSALAEDAEPLDPEPALGTHAAGGPSTGAHAAAPALATDGEPPVEEVEVTDLLLVLDLTDEVLVVDEHPRYHLAGCPQLSGVETIPLRMDEARSDGFTPCGTCAPDRNLAERERARRTG
jgi:membrane protein implicated in regulation of membrane protease activity